MDYQPASVAQDTEHGDATHGITGRGNAMPENSEPANMVKPTEEPASTDSMPIMPVPDSDDVERDAAVHEDAQQGSAKQGSHELDKVAKSAERKASHDSMPMTTASPLRDPEKGSESANAEDDTALQETLTLLARF